MSAVSLDELGPTPQPDGTPAWEGTPVLEARGIEVHFDAVIRGRRQVIRAADGVDLKLHRGQIMALVGESGSGKTTLARVFALIYRHTGGELYFDGRLLDPKKVQEKEYYTDVQLIFQDPFNSLNSLKKISYIVGRAIKIHKVASGRTAVREKTVELLERVNLTPAAAFIDRYPSDLSGGQRQRVAIARSLAVSPKVLLADEPTSMLDASIRLDVLNLLQDLRRKENLAVLFITHDIASARYLSDTVTVMYGGVVVESGPTEEVVSNPQHPYTRLLLASAPDPAHYKGSPKASRFEAAEATPWDNTRVFAGCRFVERCPVAIAKCSTQPPPTVGDGAHKTACWLLGAAAPGSPGGSQTDPKPSQPLGE
ncbi:MAG: ABC transporter ATP-binding protein [Candidatus Nanopelagicales bacterium]